MTHEEEIHGLKAIINMYARHQTWKCAYHQECHCGLDDACDSLGIERVPYSAK